MDARPPAVGDRFTNGTNVYRVAWVESPRDGGRIGVIREGDHRDRDFMYVWLVGALQSMKRIDPAHRGPDVEDGPASRPRG